MPARIGAGAATEVGSRPGTDPSPATYRLVVDAVLDRYHLPFLPELPGRPYADMIDRAVGVLPALALDLQPAGWRLTGGSEPGLDQRRARSLLAQDIDVLEESAAAGSDRDLPADLVKVALAGPWTTAAAIELPRGGAVLGDAGARRDLVDSLAAAAAEHVGTLARRLPGRTVLLQVDEPTLPAVLAGRIPTPSGRSRYRPVEPEPARQALAAVVDAVHAAGALVAVHCCAPAVPVGLIRDSGADLVSLDLTTADRWDTDRTDELAGWIEASAGDSVLMAGLVPSSGTPSGPAAALEVLRRWWSEVGLERRLLSGVVCTPTCGLAGATPPEVESISRTLIELAGEVATVAEA